MIMSNIIIKDKSIEDYIDFPNFDTGTFADDLSRRTQNSGIPSWVYTLFRDYLKLNYYGMYYSLIPLTVEDDEFKEKYYMHNISKIICRTFIRNKQIISQMVENSNKLLGLEYEKIVKDINRKSGNDTHTNSGEDVIENKAMVETSPITSGSSIDGEPNYAIDTPSGRNMGKSSTEYGKITTIDYNSSNSNDANESNPYYFEKFMQIIEKYNIYTIYDTAIRSVIKEFIEVY